MRDYTLTASAAFGGLICGAVLSRVVDHLYDLTGSVANEGRGNLFRYHDLLSGSRRSLPCFIGAEPNERPTGSHPHFEQTKTDHDPILVLRRADAGLRERPHVRARHQLRFVGEAARWRYTCYMSSQPIRIGKETLQTLRERSKGSGEPLARLAERYIEEGLRADRHPGVFFREGPAGRRPVVVGGPDVWEIVSALRGAPEKGEALVSALAERVGISDDKVRVAIRYYAEFPEEIDDWIAANDAEAERLEAALARERELLA